MSERQAEACRMRERGFTLQQIANRYGVSISTALRWTNPDVAAASRKRSLNAKRRRQRSCSVCGVLMSWDNEGTLCTRCGNHSRRYWTRERIIAAIRRWAEVHGKPPSARDWRKSTPGYPPSSRVYRASHSDNPFDKWADAIEAAGFPRPRVGHYERREAP